MPHEVSEEVLRKNVHKVPTAKTELGTTLRNYTMEDVELTLRVLALNGGNYSRTSLILDEEHGLAIHSQTIQKWATVSFTNRYIEVISELKERIGERLSAKLSDVAIQGAEVQEKLIGRLDDRIDDLAPKELPGAIRNMAQANSMSIEKMQLLRGQATDRVQHMKPEEIVEELKSLDIDLPEEAVEEIIDSD